MNTSKLNTSRSVIKQKANKKKEEEKQVSLINEKVDWNGSMFPFRGTSELYEQDDNNSNSNCAYEIDDDDGWMANSNGAVSNAIKLNNSLGSLISAYNSSDDSDSESLVDVKKLKDNMPTILSDDEAPVEEKIIKQPIAVEDLNQKLTKPDIATTMRSKGKRKRSRKQPSMSNKRLKGKKVNNHSKRIKSPNALSSLAGNRYKKRNVTLLEKLLSSEIQHERNVLLQCVKYVVQNNYFLENKL